MINRKLLTALYFFPVSILLALFIGPILRDGMFVDGLVYTNIAKNLSEGIGTFWSPLVYREGVVFYEHPVLLPYIESFFFTLFGDCKYTEDIYNMSILFGVLSTMYLLWERIIGRSCYNLFFIPFLLWCLGQENQLRYPNTMLECGTTLVLLVTTLLFFKFKKHYVLSNFIVGFGVFIATICKGPFGLFLLSLPFLYELIVFRKMLVSSLLVPLFSMIVCFAVLFVVEPEALEFFQKYLDQQVFAAIKGERSENIASSRFDFIFFLVMMNLPAIIIFMLLSFVKSKSKSKCIKEGLLFIALGFSAILPLVVSIKQAAYYQVPSVPFFILGGCLVLENKIRKIVYIIQHNKLYAQGVLIVGSLGLLYSSYFAFSMVGTIDKRDQFNIELSMQMAIEFEKIKINEYSLKVSKELTFDGNTYSLVGFLYRNHSISINEKNDSSVQLIYGTKSSDLLAGREIIFNKGYYYLSK